jgi:hypothetical protein
VIVALAHVATYILQHNRPDDHPSKITIKILKAVMSPTPDSDSQLWCFTLSSFRARTTARGELFHFMSTGEMARAADA